MHHGIAKDVHDCQQCKVVKSYYSGPNTLQGSVVAHYPLHHLCINFIKIDPLRDGTEDIIILTDAFSKLNQAFVTTNQKAITSAKILIDKWFYVYGILDGYMVKRW